MMRWEPTDAHAAGKHTTSSTIISSGSWAKNGNDAKISAPFIDKALALLDEIESRVKEQSNPMDNDEDSI